MAQLTVTLTYRTYSNATPTVITTATATVNVPAGITADQHVKNIFVGGVFTFSDSTGLYTFIPSREVVKITSP